MTSYIKSKIGHKVIKRQPFTQEKGQTIWKRVSSDVSADLSRFLNNSVTIGSRSQVRTVPALADHLNKSYAKKSPKRLNHAFGQSLTALDVTNLQKEAKKRRRVRISVIRIDLNEMTMMLHSVPSKKASINDPLLHGPPRINRPTWAQETISKLKEAKLYLKRD
uniref:Uncharacterized protein n=1 Tax=Romanomermis culicivorax TaxID=13658 RepID=A0A915JDG8_ROMCU